MDAAVCVLCRAAPRDVAIVHNNHVHVCLCVPCSRDAKVGDACPLCRVPAERIFRIYRT